MARVLTWDNVIAEMLDRVPELRPVYQHLLDTEGWAIGAYTLIFEAARFAERLAVRIPADLEAQDTLCRLAALLEEMAASSGPYLPDLMGAGFVEALDPDAPSFEPLVGLMGPASQAQVTATFGPGSSWRCRMPDGSYGPPR